MTADAPTLPNDSAGRSVRLRFMLAYLSLAPLGLLVAAGVLASSPAHRFSLDTEFWLLGGVACIILALWAGSLVTSGLLTYSVPTAIAVEPDGVRGDFASPPQDVAASRRIRFEDVRSISTTTVLRLPYLRGTPHASSGRTLPNAAGFYLTEENLAAVAEAYSKWRANSHVSGQPS